MFGNTWLVSMGCYFLLKGVSEKSIISSIILIVGGVLKQGKMIEAVNFFRGDNRLLNTISTFLSSNKNVCSLIFFIELIEKGAIALHIQVIEFFNLPNSVKWVVTASVSVTMILF